MNKRRALRQFWENIIGGACALLGVLLLALIFLLGRFVDLSVLGLPAMAAPPMPDSEVPVEDDVLPPEVILPDNQVAPVEAERVETDLQLPQSGVYAIDGATLDATMNNIDLAVKEKQRKEEERLRRIKEEKRREELRRQEEARRKAEAKRQAEEAAKKAAEAKRLAEERRKAEAQRKVEEAKQEAERKKAEEQRRAEEAKQKAAAEAERKKAEEAKRKAEAAAKKKAEAEAAAKKKAAEEAAAKKKAEAEAKAKAEAEAKAKAEAEAKAKAEAERKAKAAREAEAKLASLNVGAPSLDGLQSAVPGYGQGDVDAYSATLLSVVKRYYSVPANIPSNLSAKFVIKINAQGRVTDVKLSKSSGYPLFDSSARNAIMSASPLPLPSNTALRDAAIRDGILFNFTI